ncbi:NAD(P)H-binding protein [Nocardioides sp. zg-1308]|uniref:NAD(P)H-binding protein n=1 Tax=Nocardioides renjunii TaxID=3095075 RepID=A0ABU5KBT2_9ACTN|nr:MULTISPECIES: NAD(P)H-binding protein [unclassified Nocardioides]MDZ5662302.1 NAD(P)H-binding protein [Nocardioides sp. S-58]NPD06001.1 NAD(P)H-binding protein [Nocardioides sp. zg-1308]
MRIAVLGATGRTGRPLVGELLRRGHTVVALVRDPARLGDVAQRVDVVRGDSRSAADRERLVTGADAVVSALRPTAKEASLHTDTATALVGAMQRAPEYVASSASAVRASTCRVTRSRCPPG